MTQKTRNCYLLRVCSVHLQPCIHGIRITCLTSNVPPSSTVWPHSRVSLCGALSHSRHLSELLFTCCVMWGHAVNCEWTCCRTPWLYCRVLYRLPYRLGRKANWPCRDTSLIIAAARSVHICYINKVIVKLRSLANAFVMGACWR